MPSTEKDDGAPSLVELVTGAEAARRFGFSRERLRQLAGRSDFPRPLGRVGAAVVWRWPALAEWAEEHRPSTSIETASGDHHFRTIPDKPGLIEIRGPQGERESAVAWLGTPIMKLEPVTNGVRVVTATRAGEVRRNMKGFWTLQSAVHTAPKEGGWVNFVARGGPTLTRHRSQEAAIKAGRALARGSQVEHVVHDRSGKIVRRDTYEGRSTVGASETPRAVPKARTKSKRLA